VLAVLLLVCIYLCENVVRVVQDLECTWAYILISDLFDVVNEVTHIACYSCMFSELLKIISDNSLESYLLGRLGYADNG
jgi:hypothetical protein